MNNKENAEIVPFRRRFDDPLLVEARNQIKQSIQEAVDLQQTRWLFMDRPDLDWYQLYLDHGQEKVDNQSFLDSAYSVLEQHGIDKNLFSYTDFRNVERNIYFRSTLIDSLDIVGNFLYNNDGKLDSVHWSAIPNNNNVVRFR